MSDKPRSGDRADELARSLRALRAAAGLDQIPAARAAGIGQATLSRAENGEGALRSENLARLLDSYGVIDADERERLLALTQLKRDERVDARVILQAGAHHVQRRIHDLEQNATHIRAYQPAGVLGIVQTTEYMTAVFAQRGAPDSEITKRVAERIRRRDLLDDPIRRWTLIHTEGALRWHMHSPTLMAAQLHSLVTTSHRPNVRLGLIDWRTPTTFQALHGFHLYDDETAVVGTRDGTAFITDPHKIADYLDLFDHLEQLAVFDEDARTGMAHIARDYTNLAARSM